MSQESNVTPVKRPKHSSRAAQRNRPILVTENAVAEEQTGTVVESQPSESTPPVATITATTPKRKLPNFFSTVGKSESKAEDNKSEVDQAQARLARATRTTRSVTQTSKAVSKEIPAAKVKEKEKESTKPAPAKASSTPARPNSVFKTKHIIGIAIYLLAANFVGLFETAALRSIHADTTLTSFNLFGGKVTITTSTLLFLATLVIILVLLAKFDFIPRSLGGAQPARTGKGTSAANKSGTPAVKTPPTAIRPGVKGADDKLYEAYRMNQKREKKR